MTQTIREDLLRTYAEEVITVADSAIGLTLSNLYVTPPCKKIEMFLESAPIRFRVDGTDPDASTGEVINPYDRMTVWHMRDAERFKAIRTGSTSGKLRVRYKR